MQLVHVDLVPVAVVIVLLVLVVPRVIVGVVALEVAVGVLVVAGIAEAAVAGLDEAEPDAEDDVQAGGELHRAEELVLLQHFEVAGESEQTVGAGLMLRADAIAADLVAELGEADVFESRDVLDDVLEVVDVGEVGLHGLVEIVDGLRQLLPHHQSQQVGEIAGPVEDHPFHASVQHQS